MLGGQLRELDSQAEQHSKLSVVKELIKNLHQLQCENDSMVQSVLAKLRGRTAMWSVGAF